MFRRSILLFNLLILCSFVVSAVRHLFSIPLTACMIELSSLFGSSFQFLPFARRSLSFFCSASDENASYELPSRFLVWFSLLSRDSHHLKGQWVYEWAGKSKRSRVDIFVDPLMRHSFLLDSSNGNGVTEWRRIHPSCCCSVVHLMNRFIPCLPDSSEKLDLLCSYSLVLFVPAPSFLPALCYLLI